MGRYCWFVAGVLLLVAQVQLSQAQVLIEGTITDANTGEPLAAATVQVEGTYHGTITNAEEIGRASCRERV